MHGTTDPLRVSSELGAALAESRDLGFLGPGELDPHIESARCFVDVLTATLPSSEGISCLDLGSGGGVPGLIIAEYLPETNVVLLDASEKRVAWLRDVQKRLMVRTGVELGRAEELGRRDTLREAFEVVVARSFGHPAATLECASSFVRPGGIVLISETPADRAWPDEGLGALGLEYLGVFRSYGFGVVSFRKQTPIQARYPRRNGVPVRKPLFEV